MTYKLSRDAQIQRQSASIKLGEHSKIIDKLSNCHNCYFRSYCGKYHTGKIDMDKGCKDIRQAWLNNLKQFTKPESMLLKQLVDIKTKLDFRNLMDGKDQELSKDTVTLMKLYKDFMKMLLDYKSKAAPKLSVVKHIREDECFDIKGE